MSDDDANRGDPEATSENTAGGYARPGDDDPRSLRGYEAFLDQARWLFESQWRRGESFERKAGALLGFVGIILPLQVAVVRSIITAPRTPFAWAIAILFAVSAVALAWTAFKSVLVLKPRRYQTPSTEQLCEEWEQYKASGHLSPEGVVELVSKQLIEGSAGKVSPLKSIRADADSRSENFSGAIRAALTSTIMIALVLVMVAFHEATAKEATNGNREAATATTAKTNPPTTAVPSRTK